MPHQGPSAGRLRLLLPAGSPRPRQPCSSPRGVQSSVLPAHKRGARRYTLLEARGRPAQRQHRAAHDLAQAAERLPEAAAQALRQVYETAE